MGQNLIMKPINKKGPIEIKHRYRPCERFVWPLFVKRDILCIFPMLHQRDEEQVIERDWENKTMSVVGSKSCIFSLSSHFRENDKSSRLNSINKPSIDPRRFPRNLGVTCKISGRNGAEEIPGKNGVSLSSKNKMEDYNTAMKRLMRSPYEYHHDLGTNMPKKILTFRHDLVSFLSISNKNCSFEPVWVSLVV